MGSVTAETLARHGGGLVVGAAVLVEGGDVHIKQGVGFGIARHHDHIALVQFDAYPAVDGVLRVVDAGGFIKLNALRMRIEAKARAKRGQ